MKSRKLRALRVVAALVALCAVGQWWWFRPQRTVERFASVLSHGEYAEADALLVPPSALVLVDGGGLLVTDRAGREVAVPAGRLPFLAGERAGWEDSSRGLRPSGRFTMIGLGDASREPTGGPVVSLLLTTAGGRVHIDSIE